MEQQVGAARRARDPAQRALRLRLLGFQVLPQPDLGLRDAFGRVREPRRLAVRSVGTMSGAHDDAVAPRLLCRGSCCAWGLAGAPNASKAAAQFAANRPSDLKMPT